MIYKRAIYVLELQNNKYYVGKSERIPERLKQHFKGYGAVWTKKHRPIKVLDILEEKNLFTEDNITKEMMLKYGIENVRGGSYCKVSFSKMETKFLQKELRGLMDLCYFCGEKHYFRNCTNRNNKKE